MILWVLEGTEPPNKIGNFFAGLVFSISLGNFFFSHSMKKYHVVQNCNFSAHAEKEVNL